MARKKVEPQFPAEGLECPGCGCSHWLTVYTRRGPGNTIFRRRQCRHCGVRLTTVEQPAEVYRERVR